MHSSNRLTLLLLICAFIFILSDGFERLYNPAESTNLHKAKLPQFNTITKTQDGEQEDIIKKYQKFDYRWEQAVLEAEGNVNKNDGNNGITYEVLSIVAIFNENTPFAIAKLNDRDGNFIKELTLNVGQRLNQYTVSAINENNVEFKSTEEQVILALFKSNNNITLKYEDNDES